MRLLAFALLVAAAACGSTDTAETPAASSRPTYLSTDIFEDVPAPRDAVYMHNKHESFSYRTATFRSGKFLYAWKGTQPDAVAFFKQTMSAPPYRWTLTGDSTPVTGSTKLTFVKGADTCTVDIDNVPRVQQRANVTIIVRVNYRR